MQNMEFQVIDAEPMVTRARKDKYHTGKPEYLKRQIVAWDGEGVNVSAADGTVTHKYVLLANSLGQKLIRPNGIRTGDVFRFLLTGALSANKDAIHVIYGGGYDFNMFLQSFPRQGVEAVYQRDYFDVGPYRLGIRPGKNFFVKDRRHASLSITLFDTISFFQRSFVQACDEYLGNDWLSREEIIREKAARSNFKLSDLDTIIKYNDAELANLVALITELRERLYKVGISITRWDGPGAIAAAVMRKNNTRSMAAPTLYQTNLAVSEAARYAYAGGRFELVRCGHYDGTVYQYDINSAYPYALSQVPRLDSGTWEHIKGDPGRLETSTFALYHVDYESDGSDILLPSPLFRRDRDGTICFPYQVVGWYWTPEAEAARAYAERHGYKFDITETWIWHPRDDAKPFGFIPDYYEQRRKLKAAGDGANIGLKLALNSMYGKLAQQIGWQPERKLSNGKIIPGRIPPYHQLEWAGYTTSYTRSLVWGAIANNPEVAVSFETDSVMTTEPLPHLTIGGGLGEWELSTYDNVTYLQSGVYFAERDGKEIAKYRGFDKGTITRAAALSALKKGKPIEATLTRFITMGSALHTDFSRWAKWETSPRKLAPYPSGKRAHTVCGQCSGSKFTLGVFHETHCPATFVKQHSQEFPIGWVNPNPEMSELEELRYQGEEQWLE